MSSGKSEQKKKESKNYLHVNLEKPQCNRKREVHSSNHRINLEKLSAAAVGERREEEKKEERKRWRHHLKHQSYVCEKICKNHLTIL